MGKIKVGVVGVGYFGQFHVEKYSKMEEVELVGVVDLDPVRSREVAQRYKTLSFENHRQLFDRVQAVSIVSSTPSHYSIAKDFLLRGIDVLLEKPMVTNLREAEDLIRIAEQKRLVLQVGHLERFNGAFLATQDLIHEPRFIEFQRLTPFTGRGIEVDVVLDLMIHDLDVLLSWISSPIQSIFSVGFPILTSNSDVAHTRIEFKNGCIASLLASRFCKEKVRKALIFQPDSSVLVDFLTQKASYVQKEGDSGMRVREIQIDKSDPLELEVRDFIQSVRERRVAKVSGEEGRRVLELALQIIHQIQSARKST